MKPISIKQEQVLRYLALFRHLTAGQLMRLGISKDRANLNRLLRELKDRKKPLVISQEYGVYPGIGRLEQVHFLSPFGASLLATESGINLSDIRRPAHRQSLFVRDYHHRLFTVDLHIALWQWKEKEAARELVFFHSYFDKKGISKRSHEAATKIDVPGGGFLMADAAFLLQSRDKQGFFLAEICCGKDTGRVVLQLEKHRQALVAGSPSAKYQLEKANRVLCIIEQENYLPHICNRLKSDSNFENFKPFYLFKTVKGIQEGFAGGWVDLTGSGIVL